jgi:hypothetical protein
LIEAHLKHYQPHEGQLALHYAMQNYDYVAMICGIRGGKTYSGAREAVRQAWNSTQKGVYGIISPTFNMLDRTTWMEFKEAARPFIAKENDSKKIIVLKNGRRVHGHSAENADRIRNETFVGFWVDEARECKNFGMLWDVLLGRVLSTGGKGFITTSPNSFDDIHKIFIEQKKPNYKTIRFSTYKNKYIDAKRIQELAQSYDAKNAEQEIGGQFVIFEGAVYYTFSRADNAGDLAFELCRYNPSLPLCLACDFNIDPMSWVIAQVIEKNGLKKIVVIDEIFMRNTNTEQACREFKSRFPNHISGLYLYGDATGHARHTDSNVTNWKIIENELQRYGITKRVPTSNPAERDRINALNSMIRNSKGDRRILVNPNCKKLIADLEQVAFKEGSTQIDKNKNLMLTHISDALGYMTEKDFGLNKGLIEGLKI